MTSFIDQNRVKIVININNFLNSIEERVNDYKKNIFDVIIKQYTSIEVRDHKIDKKERGYIKSYLCEGSFSFISITIV